MRAIVDTATGVIEQVVANTDGTDTSGKTVVDMPADYATRPYKWNGAAIVVDDAPIWRALRTERDARLAACDWTQLADQAEGRRTAWQPYRQALRDLPEATTNPASPTWPTEPTDA